MPTVQSTDSGYRYWADDLETVRLEFQGRAGSWVCNLCGADVNEMPGQTFESRAEFHAQSHRSP
jgi:hypothetical protein